MPAWHLPRKLARLLRYLVLAAVLCTLVCYSRVCSPSTPFSLANGALTRYAARRADVDYAWGSILHRFQNHPRPPRERVRFPWSRTKRSRGKRRRSVAHTSASSKGERNDTQPPIRVLIVTSELSGLHKNGGIGTAFSELAQTLAAADNGLEFETSILVTHLEETFPVRQRQSLQEE